MRVEFSESPDAPCTDPLHDLADQLVEELFADADALGIPRDAATVRQAVRAKKQALHDLREEDRLDWNVHRAQAIGGRHVPDLWLTSDRELPGNINTGEADSRMRADAQMIENALFRSLPQGTIDHLTARMLQRAASHLTVREEDL
jgi:hypothetical protein